MIIFFYEIYVVRIVNRQMKDDQKFDKKIVIIESGK